MVLAIPAQLEQFAGNHQVAKFCIAKIVRIERQPVLVHVRSDASKRRPTLFIGNRFDGAAEVDNASESSTMTASLPQLPQQCQHSGDPGTFTTMVAML